MPTNEDDLMGRYDESRGHSVKAAAVSTVALAALFVVLRFVSRAGISGRVGIADGLILLSLCFSAASTAGMWLQVEQGRVGRHIETLGPEHLRAWFEISYYTILAYSVSLLSTKLGILLLYLEILSTIFVHRICYMLIAAVGLLGCYLLLSNVFVCNPPAAFWDPAGHPGAWCFSGEAKWSSDIALHLLTELVILVFPMPFIHGLGLPWPKKIAVSCLLGLGAIVILVSVLRIPYIVRAVHTTDPSWDAADIAIWSSIEVNIAIICACCMTLKPLVARMCPKFTGSSYRLRVSDGESPSAPRTVGSGRERPPFIERVTVDAADFDLPMFPDGQAGQDSAEKEEGRDEEKASSLDRPSQGPGGVTSSEVRVGT